MRTALFDYQLPEELIAQRPPADRDGARMLILNAGIEDAWVREFSERVPPGALVVLNETRVRRARLTCRRPSVEGGGGGGRVELLLLGPSPHAPERWFALGKANKPLRPGDRLLVNEPEKVGEELASSAPTGCVVEDKDDEGTLTLRFEAQGIQAQGFESGERGAASGLERWLEQQGQMPIPPYLRRPADEDDVERYQTVFARELGSVAAPTASLHLTEAALDRLAQRGVRVSQLVLHVGIGTFRPVSVDDLDRHPMHAETVHVSESLVDDVRRTRQRGAPVVAVGTTVVRALEAAAAPEGGGLIRPFHDETRLLIQPGYRFRVVDALLTNFHMPKSTLLALVAAFAGRERVMEAYRHALASSYRFLSYGDSMWIPGRLP